MGRIGSIPYNADLDALGLEFVKTGERERTLVRDADRCVIGSFQVLGGQVVEVGASHPNSADVTSRLAKLRGGNWSWASAVEHEDRAGKIRLD
ncbi:MAG: hypothetical protein K2Q20_08550 [Phycisphaerales bacterium]|nr:hypothetical protein [Phycisphaerales bacterium]